MANNTVSKTNNNNTSSNLVSSTNHLLQSEQAVTIIYPRLELLGEGTYGQVYLTERDGQQYAMKLLLIDDEIGIENLNEIDIMSRIKHPNIMHLVDFYFTDSMTFLIMPIGDTTLDKYITTNNPSYNTRIRLFYEITSAIYFLNTNGIIHHDLKPNNIIIKNDRAMLTDFGLSLYLPSKQIKPTTREYEPPEVTYLSMGLSEAKYAVSPDKIDLWSLGCLFYFILTGEVLFAQYQKIDLYQIMGIDYLTKGKEFPPEVIPVLANLLALNPKERSHVFNFPLFTERNYQAIPGVIIKTSPIQDVSCYPEDEIKNNITWIFTLGSHFNVRAEAVFLAVDIFYRNYYDKESINAGTGTEQGYNTGQQDNKLLATVCFHMALVIIRDNISPIATLLELCTGEYTEREFILLEISIISKLRGVLYAKNLYNYAISRKCLRDSLEILSDCKRYFSKDPLHHMSVLALKETPEQRENRLPKNTHFRKLL